MAKLRRNFFGKTSIHLMVVVALLLLGAAATKSSPVLAKDATKEAQRRKSKSKLVKKSGPVKPAPAKNATQAKSETTKTPEEKKSEPATTAAGSGTPHPQSASEQKKPDSPESIDKESRRHVWPSEGAQGDAFRDAAKELRCPTCTGLSVLESDAAFSVQIKDIVREQVEAGKSKDEILKYFTARFGPWILRSPPVSGFNLFAWALPLGILLLGPPLIWFFIWRKRRVVNTVGVRPDADIVREMQERLAHLRTPTYVWKR
jgi:cytochrome c-type biogenesis protein CcmH